ncbi:transaldolase [Spirosoma validum]|uniref:Transaldolase n=1 Tax=Spirosoma validum TaxID=2771355 RepID=A0A927B8W5_9BACT|nr:transaldolase [Spirosoma validum]MBD2757423.1 transaldolase [Spirosoma validum]
MNRVKQIHELGQSIWLDFIDRQLMNTGALQTLIQEDGIRGLTSNPAIFEKAISNSPDYDEDIKRLAQTEKSNEALFYGVAVTDIQRAADLFAPVYEDKISGADGFVSLEVSPHFALDAEKTIEQARSLWQAVDRPNVMIKIPGTQACLPAIRQTISEGININVTLLFGLDRYLAVTEAYIAGLEDRLQAGHPIDQLASVASFFISRIDTLVDPLLKEQGLSELTGEVAIALAKQAYASYSQVFDSERFKKLADAGAVPQRLLWASTGTKDPAFSDVKYVEALIGPKTVNTVPMDTLNAFRDHGQAALRLASHYEDATQVLDRVQQAGIDLNAIAQQLEDEGIQKFNDPYDKLMQAIDQQRNALVSPEN